MGFVVIGAGMAGIFDAIRLREAGYDDVVVQGDVGAKRTKVVSLVIRDS